MKGFTLIEVMVALALLAVGLGALMTAIGRGVSDARRLVSVVQARYEQEAAELVTQAVQEALKNDRPA